MINKKAQEEIVGFVVIVIIVSIIALIFLSFSLRNEPSLKENAEIEQFLGSALEYTTECSLGFSGNYAEIGELFEACKDGRQCYEGESSCRTLEKVMPEIIDSGFNVGEDRPVKGYLFKSVFAQNASQFDRDEEVIILINQTEKCSGDKKMGVGEFRPSDEGIIRSSLEICY